jgi:polyferredoxin
MNEQDVSDNRQVEDKQEDYLERNFKVKDWIEWILSVIALLFGLFSFGASMMAGVFWSLLGGAFFVKQLMKYKGKGEDNPATQKANMVVKLLKYFIIALILLVIGGLIIGVILNPTNPYQ